MRQRKCPKCNGVMSDLYTSRGWGEEGMYVCDTCKHTKNIYEGKTIGPYIFFLLFEIIIFFLEDEVSSIEYTIYGVIFCLLLFLTYKAQTRDNIIKNDYALINNNNKEFTPNQQQLEALKGFKKQAKKQGSKIKRTIAFIIFFAYSVIFYSEDKNMLTISDYIFYIGLIFILPSWLWFSKFKE